MGQSTEELNRDIEASRQNLSRDIDELSDKVSPARVVHRQTEAAKSKLSSLRHQVMGTASDATSAVSGSVSDTASSAAGSVQGVAQGIQGAAQGAVGSAQGHPLAAGLAAFGVGMVISSLIPASKQESQVAQRAVDTAKEYATPVLQEGADQLKEAAAHAADDVKQSAQEAASHVVDEASSAVDAVKDDAQSSAQSVASTAQDEGISPS